VIGRARSRGPDSGCAGEGVDERRDVGGHRKVYDRRVVEGC
jgi:hypothetical protein